MSTTHTTSGIVVTEYDEPDTEDITLADPDAEQRQQWEATFAAAEIERNLSQIEQLDARYGRLRDACATWERANNNYAEAVDNYAKAVEIKDAEIEQLRQLVDAVFTKWLEDSDPDELPELIKRVRAALGDEIPR